MMVGREAELELLRDAWRQASTRGPGIAVIRGEAGIGKSRLVDELGRMVVAEGGIVLAGGCAPYVGEAVSFAPFRDALRPLFEDRATLGMTVPASSALREMWGPSAPGSDGPPPSPEVGQARLFEAVRSALIGATANQPALFVLEDVHWADRSSLALLAFLDRAFDRHRGSGLLLVVTCRDDPPQAVAGVIGELQRRRALIMSVPPLNASAVRLMLGQLPGHLRDESWAAEVVERADGNPFLVEELAAAPNGDPVAAREVLALRLAGLSPATLRTLRTMAVLGRQVPHDLVTAVAGVPEPALLAGLREAVEAGVLLAQAPDTYRFRHALLQEHLHGQFLPAERRLLHRRAGDALAAEAAIGRAGETAYHYDNADSGPESVYWGVRAAEEAEQLHALPEALNHYRRVLQVWPFVPDADGRAGRPRIDILRRAASLADILGHRQVAADLLAEASALLGQDASDETLAVLLADQAWAQSAVSPAAAAGLLAQAVGLLAAEPSSPDAAYVLALSPSALLMLGRYDDAAPLVSRAVTTARSCGSRVALVSLSAARAYWRCSRRGWRLLL
jgi:predicted ATPase